MKQDYICKYCNKICKNANSLRNHERLCKLNPNKDDRCLKILYENREKGKCKPRKGHKAWNKGLTKNNDLRVAKYTQTRHEHYLNGTLSESAYKHYQTIETRKQISIVQKENYKNISRYTTVREKRKSYAEQYFNEIFTDAEKQYHVDRYFLDYAWADIKVYIEVDGEQHYTKEGILHDKIRTENLIKLGWRLLKRIRWSDWQKLSIEDRENEIYRLKQTIRIQQLTNYALVAQMD